MDMATSASKLFTWPSVARSTSIIIFVIVLLYHCIVASLWLAACCLMLGQAPPARAEAIVISDLTPDPIALVRSIPATNNWIRAQGRGYCVGDPSPRSVEGRSQS